MKIRNGFVSNSSSSSFVIIGDIIKLNDVDENDLKNKKYSYIAETGLYGESGPVFMDIESKKTLALLKKAENGEFGSLEGRVKVYKAYFQSFGDGGKLKTETLPKETTVYSGECDQWGPMDAKELEYSYKGEF
jgi:hypothetical protein